MSSPMALTSPRQDSIFKKSSLPRVTSLQPYITTISEVNTRARIYHSARVTSTPPLSPSSTATLSEGTVLTDTPCEKSNGLAYPTVPPTEQAIFTNPLQFGFCPNNSYRYKSSRKPGRELKEAHQHEPPYYIIITTYLSFLFLICVGHIRDFFGKRLRPALYRHLVPFNVSHVPISDSRAPGLLGSVCRP